MVTFSTVSIVYLFGRRPPVVLYLDEPPRQYDVGLAINCLANIATPGLSRDLISDLVQLLGNHKPYVRKKALLAM